MAAKFDVSAVFRAADRLNTAAKGLDQVERVATATLVRRLPPEATRDIQATHNLPASRIRESLSARVSGNAVELIGGERGVTLMSYGATWNKATGVTVTIERADGPQNLRHMFIREGLNGNRLVFQRKGQKRRMTAGRYAGTREERQPLVSGYGPSIATTLRHRDRGERLAKFSMSILSAEVQRLIGVFRG